MINEFVSYEIALELKQLGFDEPCIAFYNGRFLDFKIWNDDGREASQINVNMDVGQCPNAPTFSQVFRWFREKYVLEGVVQQSEDFTWYKWMINQYYEDGKKYVADWYEYKTYEEAELTCLMKLIEIAKN
jgi:hypothetical protein